MTAIYTGSFDPITCGHIDIVRRASKMADCLIVALLDNPNKQSLFLMQERMAMLRHELADIPNIEIDAVSGMLAAYALKKNAAFVIRGVRNWLDFDYESQMAYFNNLLTNGIDTIFLPTNPEFTQVSCSAVKEAARLIYKNNFDDSALRTMVTPHVLNALKARFLEG